MHIKKSLQERRGRTGGDRLLNYDPPGLQRPPHCVHGHQPRLPADELLAPDRAEPRVRADQLPPQPGPLHPPRFLRDAGPRGPNHRNLAYKRQTVIDYRRRGRNNFHAESQRTNGGCDGPAAFRGAREDHPGL